LSGDSVVALASTGAEGASIGLGPWSAVAARPPVEITSEKKNILGIAGARFLPL
jgi:hypothetical protein